MAKGRQPNEMTRVLEAESSTIIIYYHPISRVLFCSISDADDNTEIIKEIMHKIGRRFWKKHQSDVKIFRSTTEKNKFLTFNIDIENITVFGKVAEVFPKLLVVRSVLEKILSMGIIKDFDFHVAVKCDGKNSPLKISKMVNTSRNKINEVLKNLELLDIISIKQVNT